MDKIVKLGNGNLVKVIISNDPADGISESDAEWTEGQGRLSKRR